MCRVLLIAASRRDHFGSTCFLFQAMLTKFANLAGVGLTWHPKGPAERPTALCHVKTTRIGMQPRPPAGEAAPRIGNNYPVHGHNAQ
jgi:hypothetical protein